MRRWAPLILTITACGADDRYLAPPPLDDARSAVVVVHGDEREVVAADVSDGAWRLAVDTTTDAEIDLLLYACPLDGLQLDEGRIGIDPKGLALPRADRVFTAALDRGTTWTPLEEAPSRVTELRLAVTPSEVCAEIDVEVVTLDGVFGEPRTLEAFDADSVILGLRDGRMFRVHRDGAFTPLWVGQSGDTPYVEVKRVAPNVYYFVTSESGCLGRAVDLETIRPGACLPRVDTSSIGTYVHTDGRLTADGREILDVLTERGEMFEVIDGVARNVSVANHVDVEKKGAVLRVGDDEVLYVGVLEHGVVRRVADETRLEGVAVPFFDKVVSVARSTRFGATVLTNTGLVLTREATTNEWSALGGTGALQPLFIVEVGRSQFVVTALEGQIIELLEDGVACDATYVGGDDARALVKVGEDGFAMTIRPREDPVNVHFVRPRFAAHLCQ